MSEEYYLKHPKKQQFYHTLAICMNFFGNGKQTWWGYREAPLLAKIKKVNKLFSGVVAPMVFIGQFTYLYLHYNELTFNMKGCIFSLGTVNGLVNICQISSYTRNFAKVMKEFMNKIHLCNLDDQDEFVTKERIKFEKLTRIACFYMIVFLMIDWLGWCSILAVNNYFNRKLIKNRTMRYETTLYYPFPLDYGYNFKAWLFIHLCNSYFVWAGCLIILVHTCIKFSFIFQIIGHIEILKYRLKTSLVGSHTDAEVKEKLIKIVKHHAFILITFKKIEDAFGFFVSGYYLYNLAADSFNVYAFMLGNNQDKITYAGMIIVYMGGLIAMSFVLEEVRRQSDDISDYVYGLNWEDMSMSNKKIVQLLLLRTQSVLFFKGMGGFKTGVTPMLSIIKSTFSFYVFLKQSQ